MGNASTRATAARPDDDVTTLNLAVLCGRCSTGVEMRTLPSGKSMATFSIRTPVRSGKRGASGEEAATSVPVVAWEPPAWLSDVEVDDALVVVGVVRRRFYATRAGGRGARTGVEAVTVARATRAHLDRAWRRANGSLDALA